MYGYNIDFSDDDENLRAVLQRARQTGLEPGQMYRYIQEHLVSPTSSQYFDSTQLLTIQVDAMQGGLRCHSPISQWSSGVR